MHAVNLTESSETVSDSLESKVTQSLFEKMRQHPIKKWNAKIESMVAKKLLANLMQKKRVLPNGEINIPLMIRNCIETNKLASTEQAYQHALDTAKSLSPFFVGNSEENVEEKVAKAIFSIEQHVCPTKGPSCPFEKLDAIDYLILQQQCNLLTSYEPVSFEALKKGIFDRLQEHKKIAHLDHLAVTIAALHAHHLTQGIDFQKRWGKRSVASLEQFISKQISLHPSLNPLELVNRILFFYHLNTQKEKKGEIVEAANDYLRSLSSDLYSPSLHRLGHEVYNFINNEIRKIKHYRPLTTLKEILREVQQMFSFVDDAVALPQNQKELLELFVFAYFHTHHPLLQHVSSSQKELITKELMRASLEKGEKEFRDVVHTTHERLMRYKTLNVPTSYDNSFFPVETLMDKISHLASQNELVLDRYKISYDHPLLKGSKKGASKEESFPEAIPLVERFLKESPLLVAYRQHLIEEAVLLHKTLWYTQTKKRLKTPFERFYQWHHHRLLEQLPHLKGREILRKMEQLTTETLPLMPSYYLAAL